MNIYQEFQGDYSTSFSAITEERDLVLEQITKFAELIKSKKAHTTEAIEIRDKPNLNKLGVAIKAINEAILKHNEKTENFEEQRKTNSEKIERHYLSTIYDTIKTLDEEIRVLQDELNDLNNGVEGDDDKIGKTKLTVRIAENKAKISSAHKACEILNKSLKKFLGHDEITFSIKDDNAGYQILRRGKPAKSLSEGERTAIAFIFFVTQLKDEDFDVENGIVVIDDPVSSLDANSQFQAFSFLKEATKNAGQLFLMTHNFEFLKLLISWMKGGCNGKYALFMIKNRTSKTDGHRLAYIEKLDKSLELFESEYHYLFNVVYDYVRNREDDDTIETAYKMPNISRKLLDTFLMFRVPKNIRTYKRLEEIKYDKEKKTAIYKFTNDQSHITGSGFDPSLVPEAKKVTADLLDMMRTVDPDHFKCLVETVL
jgi:wobble nucleotide-excising tRNase